MLIAEMSDEAINIKTTTNNTVLILAACKGFKKICEMLVPKMSNGDINCIENGHGDTAVSKVIWKDLDKVCQMLIPRMSAKTINNIDKHGNTALIFAAMKGINTICKDLFLKYLMKLLIMLIRMEIQH